MEKRERVMLGWPKGGRPKGVFFLGSFQVLGHKVMLVIPPLKVGITPLVVQNPSPLLPGIPSQQATRDHSPPDGCVDTIKVILGTMTKAKILPDITIYFNLYSILICRFPGSILLLYQKSE